MTYIRTNDRAAHEFFYSEASDVTFARSLNLTFDGRQAKSYATTIALRTRDKAGDPVTLTSIDGMSNTTSRHRWLVYRSSPCRILEVPFKRGDDFRFYEDAEVFAVLSRRFLERLESASNRTMTRAENRRALIDLWRMASTFSEAVFTIDGLADFAAAFFRSCEVTFIPRTQKEQTIMTKIKCIFSGSIPAAWASALWYGDDTGLSDKDRAELDQWLRDEGLSGGEDFDFGPVSSENIRVTAWVSADDPRSEVAAFEDQWDCAAWLRLRIEGDYPRRWTSPAALARELIPTAGALDRLALQAVIDDGEQAG